MLAALLLSLVACGKDGQAPVFKTGKASDGQTTDAIRQASVGVLPDSVSIINSPDDQSLPDIAYDVVNDRFMIVWTDARNSKKSGIDIYGAIIDSIDASLVVNEFLITNASGDQLYPKIAFDNYNKDQFLVVWGDSYADTIKGLFIDSNINDTTKDAVSLKTPITIPRVNPRTVSYTLAGGYGVAAAYTDQFIETASGTKTSFSKYLPGPWIGGAPSIVPGSLVIKEGGQVVGYDDNGSLKGARGVTKPVETVGTGDGSTLVFRSTLTSAPDAGSLLIKEYDTLGGSLIVAESDGDNNLYDVSPNRRLDMANTTIDTTTKQLKVGYKESQDYYDQLVATVTSSITLYSKRMRYYPFDGSTFVIKEDGNLIAEYDGAYGLTDLTPDLRLDTAGSFVNTNDGSVRLKYKAAIDFTNTIDSADGIDTSFTNTVPNTPLAQGTVEIYEGSSTLIAVDKGDGTFTDKHNSTGEFDEAQSYVNYDTGEVVIEYQTQNIVTSEAFGTSNGIKQAFTKRLVSAPVDKSTVNLYESEGATRVKVATDDGAGGFIDYTTAKRINTGASSINYTTGDVTFTYKSTSVYNGVLIGSGNGSLLSFTKRVDPYPLEPEKVTLYNGTTKIGYDDGNGKFISEPGITYLDTDVSSINYDTGYVTVAFKQGQPVSNEPFATGTGVKDLFVKILDNHPIDPDSVRISQGGSAIGYDLGDGTIGDSTSSGIINTADSYMDYDTGELRLRYMPAIDVTDYDNFIGAVDGTNTVFSLDMGDYKTGSLVVKENGVAIASDNSNGRLTDLSGGRINTTSSKVDYSTGTLDLVFKTPASRRGVQIGISNGIGVDFNATLSATPVKGNTLNIYQDGALVATDNGIGGIKDMTAGGIVNTGSGTSSINYSTGVLKFSFDPARSIKNSTIATGDGVNTEFTKTMNGYDEGSLTVKENGTIIATDNGSGGLADLSGGRIDTTTSAVDYALNELTLAFKEDISFEDEMGIGNGAAVDFGTTLSNQPVRRHSLEVYETDSLGVKTRVATDDGYGGIVDSSANQRVDTTASSIDYSTGALNFVFKGPVSVTNSVVGNGGNTIYDKVLDRYKPGTLSIKENSTTVATDDGNGRLVDATGGRINTADSYINYNDSSVHLEYFDQQVISDYQVATGDGTSTTYNFNLGMTNVQPGSVQIRTPIGTIAVDNGAGGFSDPSKWEILEPTSTIDYATGDVQLDVRGLINIYNHPAPDYAQPDGVTTDFNFFVYYYDSGLTIKENNTIIAMDDGAGGFIDLTPGQRLDLGTSAIAHDDSTLANVRVTYKTQSYASNVSIGVPDGTKTNFDKSLTVAPIKEGTVSISQNGLTIARDDGFGNIVDVYDGRVDDALSTIDYDTGALAFRYDGTNSVTAEAIGTGDGTTTFFIPTLAGEPLKSTLTIKEDGVAIATDNGSGGLTDATGGRIDTANSSVSYSSGVVTLKFHDTQSRAGELLATADGNTATFSKTLTDIPEPGTLRIYEGTNLIAEDNGLGNITDLTTGGYLNDTSYLDPSTGKLKLVYDGKLDKTKTIGSGDGATSSFSASLTGGIINTDTVSIKENGVVIATDDGGGNLVDQTGGRIDSGSVNYSTGAVSIDFVDIPAVAGESFATSTGTDTSYSGKLVYSANGIVSNTVSIYEGSTLIATDNGAGNFSDLTAGGWIDGAASTIDYATGDITFKYRSAKTIPDHLIHDGGAAGVCTSTSGGGAVGSSCYNFTINMTSNYKRGTLEVLENGNVVATDDNNGGLIDNTNNGRFDLSQSTIDYNTGALDLYYQLAYSDGFGFGDGATTNFSTTLGGVPVNNNSVVIKVEGAQITTDDGSGGFNQPGGGYTTGELVATGDGITTIFGAAPPIIVSKGYIYPGTITIYNAGVAIATGSLNIKSVGPPADYYFTSTGPGTQLNVLQSYYRPSTGRLYLRFVTAPPNGAQITADYFGLFKDSSSVDYATGAINIDFANPVTSGYSVDAYYTTANLPDASTVISARYDTFGVPDAGTLLKANYTPENNVPDNGAALTAAYKVINGVPASGTLIKVNYDYDRMAPDSGAKLTADYTDQNGVPQVGESVTISYSGIKYAPDAGVTLQMDYVDNKGIIYEGDSIEVDAQSVASAPPSGTAIYASYTSNKNIPPALSTISAKYFTRKNAPALGASLTADYTDASSVPPANSVITIDYDSKISAPASGSVLTADYTDLSNLPDKLVPITVSYSTLDYPPAAGVDVTVDYSTPSPVPVNGTELTVDYTSSAKPPSAGTILNVKYQQPNVPTIGTKITADYTTPALPPSAGTVIKAEYQSPGSTQIFDETAYIDYDSGYLNLAYKTDTPPAPGNDITVDYEVGDNTSQTVSLQYDYVNQTSPSLVFNEAEKQFYVAWVDESTEPNNKFWYWPGDSVCTNNYSDGIVDANDGTYNRNIFYYSYFYDAAVDNSLIRFRPVTRADAEDGTDTDSDGSDIDSTIDSASLMRLKAYDYKSDCGAVEKLIVQEVYSYFRGEGSPVIAYTPSNGKPIIMWAGRRYFAQMDYEWSRSKDSNGIWKPWSANRTESFPESYNNVDVDTFRQIYMQRRDASNNLIVSGFGVQSMDNQYPSAYTDIYSSRILVAWEAYNPTEVPTGQSYIGKDIYAQLFDLQNLEQYGAMIPLSLDEDGMAKYDQTLPKVNYDPSFQRYMVVWDDNRGSEISLSNKDIYGQFVDPEGQRQGKNFGIVAVDKSQQQASLAYGNDQNTFAIVWKDSRANNQSDIYGQMWQFSVAPVIEILDTSGKELGETLEFGSVSLDQSVSKSFVIKNTGNADLVITQVKTLLSVADGTVVSLSSDDRFPFNMTTAIPQSINPNSSYTMTVRFRPTSAVTYQSAAAAIEIITNGGTRKIFFNGHGIGDDPSITTQTIDDVAVDDYAYKSVLTGTGGKPSYSWALLNSSNGGAGDYPSDFFINTVTATSAWLQRDNTLPKPTTGQYTFSVQLTDANGRKTVRDFTTNVSKISIGGSDLPEGDLNNNYNETLVAIGGTPPYKWFLQSGALPEGITLDRDSGIVSGTPTNSGEFAITIMVQDALGVSTTKDFPLKISTTLKVILNINKCTNWVDDPEPAYCKLRDAMLGDPYQFILEADGGFKPYTWSIQSGSFPTGVTINPDTGYISGTPSGNSVGTYYFILRLTDNLGNVLDQDFSLAVTKLTITPDAIVGAAVDVLYKQQLDVTGGGVPPYVWTMTTTPATGTFKLDPVTGLITGTPTVADVGTHQLSVSVVDAIGQSASTQYDLPVSTLAITTSNLPDTNTGLIYNQVVAVSGGTGPYTWSLASGELPPGLTLDTTPDITDTTIKGVPTEGGTFSFNIMVQDSTQPTGITYESPFTIFVDTNLNITTSATLPDAQFYSYYEYDLAAAGGTKAYTWSVASGVLPSGMSLNSSLGRLSGIPTIKGTFEFVIKVTDRYGIIDEQLFSLTVQPAPTLQLLDLIIIKDGFGTDPEVLVQLQATGGVPPYSFSVISGSLPPGLSLNSANGEITGIPSESGAYPFRIKVVDSTQDSTTAYYSLEVISSEGAKGSTFCFIATAAYGSYLEPDVVTLRKFRDQHLLTNAAGRAFVKFYYAASPPIANFIAKHDAARALTRAALTPVVYGVKHPMPLLGFIVLGAALGAAGMATRRRRK